MKKTIIFIVFTFTALNSVLSQQKRFSVEVNYPLPIGSNFIGESYDGIIDAGFRYRIKTLKIVNFGFGLNGSYLKLEDHPHPSVHSVDNIIIQPKLFGEFTIPKVNKLHPHIGMGYSFLRFKVNSYEEGIEGEANSGFNLNMGISYYIFERTLIQIQYDFIKLSAEEGIPSTSYNTNVSILKFGIGMRF